MRGRGAEADASMQQDGAAEWANTLSRMPFSAGGERMEKIGNTKGEQEGIHRHQAGLGVACRYGQQMRPLDGRGWAGCRKGKDGVYPLRRQIFMALVHPAEGNRTRMGRACEMRDGTSPGNYRAAS